MKKTMLFAAIAAVLASCSNDEDFGLQDNLKDTPITVTAGVAELTTRAGYATSENGDPVLPETFYLSIDQTGDKYDYNNVLMKSAVGVWNGYESDGTTEKQLLWANGTDIVTVTAATFSLDGVQTLSVQTDQSTGEAVIESDHLLMNATSIASSADGIAVNFSHLMSKVILTITLGDEFNSDANPITDVKFTGTLASRHFDHTAETNETKWSDIRETTATDITPIAGSYTKIGNDVKNATAQYEVILVPQTVAASSFAVQFKLGDRMFKWTSESAVTLESGYQYTLALTAGKDVVSSATFTTSAWNSQNGELATE